MATGGRTTGIHDVESGKLLANRWRVLDVIGGGGMGVVYRCWDLNLKTTVAVKILNKEFQDDQQIVERFHREVEILIKSAHPNIAVIHACSSREDEPPVFLVMEFLDGPTLKMVQDESPDRILHPQRILRIGTQVLDALDAVHERGIIHRDLKPENIFVLRTGAGRRNVDVTKVIDFGIAKASENRGDGRSASLTQVGTVVGTPFYMSPEQCLGASYTDHRSDIYAMGVILYEMATGRMPFDKPSREDVMAAHISEMPDAPRMINPEIFPELEMVILKALAKKPQGRFDDALEMGEALEEAIPEDKMYYRDSQRVSPVNGKDRPSALPPRHIVAPDEEPARRPADVSATPTNLLESAKRPAADIGLAKTITPENLDREAQAVAETIMAESREVPPAGTEAAEETALPAVVSEPETTTPPARGIAAEIKDLWAKVPFERAVAYAKEFGVRINEVPRQTKIIALATILIVILFAAVLITASRGCEGKTSAADIGEITETTVAETETDVFVPPARQPDVLVIPMPIPMPRDVATELARETTADTEPTEEVGRADEVSLPETVEAPPETSSAESPDGYENLLRAAGRTRNWRAAVAKIEEAARLWPEGPDAWEALGDILVTQRNQTERARNAYARCLELLPPNALSRRAVVEGKLRGLR